MFFMIEKSVLLNPGPMTTLRPRLPKRETGVNTEVSNQRSTPPMIAIGPVTSGRSVFGYAVDGAVRGDDVDGIAALRLHDRGELPALDEPVATKRQFVYCADDEAVAGVEIRRTAVAAQVIAVLHDDALRC